MTEAARGPELTFMVRLLFLAVRQPAEGGELPYAVGACVPTEGISRTRELITLPRMATGRSTSDRRGLASSRLGPCP